jgi:hypothetical protein
VTSKTPSKAVWLTTGMAICRDRISAKRSIVAFVATMFPSRPLLVFEPAVSLMHCGRLIEITSAGDRRVSFDLIDFCHKESRLLGVDTPRL